MTPAAMAREILDEAEAPVGNERLFILPSPKRPGEASAWVVASEAPSASWRSIPFSTDAPTVERSIRRVVTRAQAVDPDAAASA